MHQDDTNTNKPIPRAVWSGSFTIFGVEVKCHSLEDGTRIIEAESLERLLEAMGTPGATMNAEAMKDFDRWRRG